MHTPLQVFGMDDKRYMTVGRKFKVELENYALNLISPSSSLVANLDEWRSMPRIRNLLRESFPS